MKSKSRDLGTLKRRSRQVSDSSNSSQQLVPQDNSESLLTSSLKSPNKYGGRSQSPNKKDIRKVKKISTLRKQNQKSGSSSQKVIGLKAHTKFATASFQQYASIATKDKNIERSSQTNPNQSTIKNGYLKHKSQKSFRRIIPSHLLSQVN